jgi:hypothetical protein
LILLIDQHWQERMLFRHSCKRVKNVFVINSENLVMAPLSRSCLGADMV